MATQKEKLSSARAELKRSKRWRDTGAGVSGYDTNWRRYIDLYNCYQWDSDLGTDQLVVNIVFATKNVLGVVIGIGLTLLGLLFLFSGYQLSKVKATLTSGR